MVVTILLHRKTRSSEAIEEFENGIKQLMIKLQLTGELYSHTGSSCTVTVKDILLSVHSKENKEGEIK